MPTEITPNPSIFVTAHTVSASQLKDQIVGTIANAVGTVVQGAADDILNYATEITDALVLVQTETDPAKREALNKELLAQVTALAELNRVRATETGFETLRALFSTSSGIISGVLAAFGQGAGAAAASAVSHALGGPPLGGSSNPATGG